MDRWARNSVAKTCRESAVNGINESTVACVEHHLGQPAAQKHTN